MKGRTRAKYQELAHCNVIVMCAALVDGIARLIPSSFLTGSVRVS
jgi:hypothetical protein